MRALLKRSTARAASEPDPKSSSGPPGSDQVGHVPRIAHHVSGHTILDQLGNAAPTVGHHRTPHSMASIRTSPNGSFHSIGASNALASRSRALLDVGPDGSQVAHVRLVRAACQPGFAPDVLPVGGCTPPATRICTPAWAAHVDGGVRALDRGKPAKEADIVAQLIGTGVAGGVNLGPGGSPSGWKSGIPRPRLVGADRHEVGVVAMMVEGRQSLCHEGDAWCRPGEQSSTSRRKANAAAEWGMNVLRPSLGYVLHGRGDVVEVGHRLRRPLGSSEQVFQSSDGSGNRRWQTG